MANLASDNRTKYIILGLLDHEPLSGYDMKKRIEMSIAQFWDVGFGQLYPSLKNLEAEGMIEGAEEHNPGRPDRKVYTTTQRGRELLQRWLSEPASKEYVRYELLLKLFFGKLAGLEANCAAIQAFRERHEGAVALLHGYAEDLRRVLPESPDHLYFLLTVMFGERVYQAYLDWADEALTMLEGHANRGGEVS